MSETIEQGAVLHNAFNNFFGPVDDPEAARFDLVLEKGGFGGGNGLANAMFNTGGNVRCLLM